MSTQDAKFIFNDPNKPVHHFLIFIDINSPGTTLIGFESMSPFAAIGDGDHINTTGWNKSLDGRELVVARVSHKVYEAGNAITHETTVYCGELLA
jgi:hypothetical protein